MEANHSNSFPFRSSNRNQHELIINRINKVHEASATVTNSCTFRWFLLGHQYNSASAFHSTSTTTEALCYTLLHCTKYSFSSAVKNFKIVRYQTSDLLYKCTSCFC